MPNALDEVLKRTERRVHIHDARIVLNTGMFSLQKVVQMFQLTPDETSELFKPILLSLEAPERAAAKAELYSVIEKGLHNIKAGRCMPAREALDDIRRSLHDDTL